MKDNLTLSQAWQIENSLMPTWESTYKISALQGNYRNNLKPLQCVCNVWNFKVSKKKYMRQNVIAYFYIYNFLLRMRKICFSMIWKITGQRHIFIKTSVKEEGYYIIAGRHFSLTFWYYPCMVHNLYISFPVSYIIPFYRCVSFLIKKKWVFIHQKKVSDEKINLIIFYNYTKLSNVVRTLSTFCMCN